MLNAGKGLPYKPSSMVPDTIARIMDPYIPSMPAPSLGKTVLHTFLINRSLTESATIEIAPSGIHLLSVRSAELVTGPSADARNTFDHPYTIYNQKLRQMSKLTDQTATLQLPPLSVAALTINIEDKSIAACHHPIYANSGGIEMKTENYFVRVDPPDTD